MKTHGLNFCTKGVWALILLASGLFVGACSFETSLSGLECKDENATRAGEVCRDGYWRIDEVADAVADADLDGISDTTPPEDTTPSEDTTPLPDVITCAAPEQLCGDRCVDTQTSSSHCGACDSPCDSGLICDEGTCVAEPFCEPGASRTCFAGNDIIEQGACEGGTQYCADDGTWGECINQISPVAEMCNGEDDDCDGTVDEENPEGGAACETGDLGICNAGTETCQDGGIVCVANSGPVAENCGTDGTGNGLDDNCDGEIDEGCADCAEGATQSCYSGSLSDSIEAPSVCRKGVQTCTGGEWGACVDEVTPSVELCNDNGLDENCDGQVNEGCACTNGDERECGYSNIGECRLGTETCVEGQWGGCEDAVMPSRERCDALDHDCDGAPNNGFNVGHACTPEAGFCSNGGQLECNPTDPTTTQCSVSPTAEIIYYLDADIDGYGDPSVSQAGCTAPAGYVEDNTDCDDSDAAVNPGASEDCDGKDNNCNGTVDDGGSATCGGDQVCEDGSCCRESDSGTNRCNDELCDSNDSNCSSGYCHTMPNRGEDNRNDICLPASCEGGCGGSCLKCEWERCDENNECMSGICRRGSVGIWPKRCRNSW